MAAYCKIIDEVASLKEGWRAKCKGNTFDPEPILKLLDMVVKEAKMYLIPGGLVFPGIVAPPTDYDAPPSYETM